MGYAPTFPKRVALLSSEPACLYDEVGSEIRRIDDIKTWFDPSSGDTVALLDLGKLPTGNYILKQAGETRSISVKEQPYRAFSNALVNPGESRTPQPEKKSVPAWKNWLIL